MRKPQIKALIFSLTTICFFCFIYFQFTEQTESDLTLDQTKEHFEIYETIEITLNEGSDIEIFPSLQQAPAEIQELLIKAWGIGDEFAAKEAHDAASKAYLSALDAIRSAKIEESPLLATAHEKYAISLLLEGHGWRALSELNSSLEIRSRLFGDRSKESADTHRVIAEVLLDIGEYDKSIESYEKALEIFASLYGENSTTAADILIDMAFVLYHQNRVNEAILSAQRSLSINESTRPVRNDALLGILNDLVRFNIDIELYDEADKYAKKMATIIESLDSPPNLAKANYLSSVANLKKSTGHYVESESYFTESINYFRKEGTRGLTMLVETQIDLSDMYISLNDFIKAKPVLESAMADSQSSPRLSDIYLPRIMTKLGAVLFRLDQQTEAEDYLIKSIYLLELQDDQNALLQALRNLSSLYRVQGNKEGLLATEKRISEVISHIKITPTIPRHSEPAVTE